MYKYYVYLIKSQNRLVILSEEIEDKDYELLLNTGNSDYENHLIRTCNTFCNGYVLGAGNKILNRIEEFKSFL
jgi:hypothetical protein